MSGAYAAAEVGLAPEAPLRPSNTGRNLFTVLSLAVVLALAARVIELRPLELFRDAGNIAVFLRGYLNPSFAHLGEYTWQCAVTVCIALWGTVLAVLISVPLGLLGARNLAPHPVVIIEGILLFAVPAVRDLFDLRLFVDTPDDVRLLRRIKRDLTERGRDLASVESQYLNTVRVMHDLHVAPTRRFAHLIIPEGGDNTQALDVIVGRLLQPLTAMTRPNGG